MTAQRAESDAVAMRVVAALDAGHPGTAMQMLALWRRAHVQEARLLGLPEAAVSAQALPGGHEAGDGAAHFGVDHDGRLVGLITLTGIDRQGCDNDNNNNDNDNNDNSACFLNIDTLVVDPSRQRRGIASALLGFVLQRWPRHRLTVTTACANAPAIALYDGFGFRSLRFGTMGDSAVPVVQLLRMPAGS